MIAFNVYRSHDERESKIKIAELTNLIVITVVYSSLG